MTAIPKCKYGYPNLKTMLIFRKALRFYGFDPPKFGCTCMASSKFCAALRAAKYIRLQYIAYPAVTPTNFPTLL